MTIRKHWIVQCDGCGTADAVDSAQVQTKREILAFVQEKGFSLTGTVVMDKDGHFCSEACQMRYNEVKGAENAKN